MELFTIGVFFGRVWSALTVPIRLSEKSQALRPSGSGIETVLSPLVHLPPVSPYELNSVLSAAAVIPPAGRAASAGPGGTPTSRPRVTAPTSATATRVRARVCLFICVSRCEAHIVTAVDSKQQETFGRCDRYVYI